jgi:hypothetical protein
VDDFKIGRADRNCVDTDQNFGAGGDGHRLFAQEKLIRIAQHPGFHLLGNGQLGRSLDARGSIHLGGSSFAKILPKTAAR